MRPEGRDAILKTVAEVLSAASPVRVGIVYGSAARDQLGEYSDVDVAVGAGRPLEWDFKSELRMALAEALGREVDLVDLECLEGYLWEPLWAEGRFVLWDHDLVVRYAGKAQAYHEDVLPGWRKMIDYRLEKAFGPL